jgi:hypothetical protein
VLLPAAVTFRRQGMCEERSITARSASNCENGQGNEEREQRDDRSSGYGQFKS